MSRTPTKPLEYRVGDLPAAWPGSRTVTPRKAPFKSTLHGTLVHLAREVAHLGGREVRILLELPNGALDVRQDGKLKAEARPGRAVILSFTDRTGAPHLYPCDRFGWWEDNLHAIAVVLEDLRRAERYGVQSSLLRAGFLALPAPTDSAPAMTPDSAADAIARYSVYSPGMIVESREVARTAIRSARLATHPDKNGGDRARYDMVEAARSVLVAHHGGVAL